MLRPRLFRRREFWFPTAWGWAVLFVLAAGAGTFVATNVHGFLAANEAVGAQALVVEGWLGPDELDQAVVRFHSGRYERVITAGGPLVGWPKATGYESYAELAAAYLTAHGLEREAVVAVPAPDSAQDRTFLSAVMVREWAKESGVALDAIDVFSAGTHARRSRLLYRMAFGPHVGVGVLAAQQRGYDPKAWWLTSSGAESVVSEAIKLAWVKLFFWPGPPGSHDELWAEPSASGAEDE